MLKLEKEFGSTKRCNAHVNDFNKLKMDKIQVLPETLISRQRFSLISLSFFCLLLLYGKEAHLIFIAFKLLCIWNIIGNILDFLGKLLMSQIDRFCTSKTVQIFVNAYNREFLVVVIFHCALLLTTN